MGNLSFDGLISVLSQGSGGGTGNIVVENTNVTNHINQYTIQETDINWVDLILGTDYELNETSSNFMSASSGIVVRDARYWKLNNYVTIVIDFDFTSGNNVPALTNTIDFELLEPNIVAATGGKFMNYCRYSRQLLPSETLQPNDHPMFMVTKAGIIMKTGATTDTDQDGSIQIDGMGDNANILTFRTDGIRNNQTITFSGQLSYNSNI